MQKVLNTCRKALRECRSQMSEPTVSEEIQQRLQSALQGREAMLFDGDLGLCPRGLPLPLGQRREICLLERGH